MEIYKFDRLSKDNLHHLAYLYKASFNLSVDLDFLRKKYNTASFGAEYIGYLAFEISTNEPAGYYGVFPMPGKIGDRKILIAQSGDTMTHPKHQGKGLFTTLAKITYTLAEKEGIEFVFGFPNKNSYPGFKKKLDWSFYNDINNYSLKTGSLPFDKLAKKSTLFASVYSGFLKRKLKPFFTQEGFPNYMEQLEPGKGCVIHDENFFRYKSYYKFHTVKIAGVSCVIKIDGRLWVGAIAGCSKEQFHSVTDGLLSLAKKLGCSSVHFSVTNDSFFDKILRENFEISSKNPIGFIDLKRNSDPANFIYEAVDFDTY